MGMMIGLALSPVAGQVPSGVIFTDELSDGAGTPVTLSTSLPTPHAFQRGRATVTLAGGLDLTGGTASGMAWRVDDGDWQAFTDETITSSTWEGTLSIPLSYLAQGTMQIKPVNGLNVTPYEHANVSVTDVFVVMGQSNADGKATNNQTYTKTNFDWLVAKTTAAWAITTTDPTWNSDGSIWPALAELLDQSGIPPAFHGPVTLDGTGFANNSWNPGDTIYNSAVSRMNTRLPLSGGARAVIWIQAEADANLAADGEAWEAAFEAMYTAMSAAVDEITGIPWEVTVVGDTGAGDLGLNEVRQSILNVIDGNALIYEGPNLINETFGDTLHYGIVGGGLDSVAAEEQLDRIASMHKRVLDSLFYGGAASASAEVTGYAIDGDEITITFDRAMQNHSDDTGWAVADAEGTRTISSTAQGGSANQLVITVDQTIYGATTVSYGKGRTSVGATFGDTGSPSFPPRVIIDASAGTGAGEIPANTVAPVLVGSTFRVGDESTATDGTYSGVPTPSVGSYVWQISDTGSGGWSNISGATSAAYTPVEADETKYIRRGETAANATGSVTVYTAASTQIMAASAFTDPSDIAATVGWWKIDDAASLSFHSGDSISSVANQIGGGFAITSGGTSNAPLDTGSINSLTAAVFDGVNDFLRQDAANTSLPQFSVRAGNATVFYGYLQSLGGAFTEATSSAVNRGGAAHLWEVAFDATANTATLYFDGTQIAQSTDYSGDDDGHIFALWNVGTVNNANDTIIANHSTQGLIFGQYEGAQYGAGQFGEAVWCDSVLSGDDLTNMRSYFNRWGLSL